MWLGVIKFYILISIATAQHDLSIGDVCEIFGLSGICVLDTECDTIKVMYDRSNTALTTKRCGFEGLRMIVCCLPDLPIEPKLRDSDIERIFSQRKSEEACDNLGERPPRGPPRVHKHIVFGEDAEEEDFPQFAALGYENENRQTTYDCGGVLISESFVLTAAHCIRNSLKSVRFGILSMEEKADDNYYIIDAAVKVRPAIVWSCLTV